MPSYGRQPGQTSLNEKLVKIDGVVLVHDRVLIATEHIKTIEGMSTRKVRVILR